MRLLHKFLPFLALAITTILCFELVNAGYEKFFDVKSGSDRTVSLDFLTRLRTSVLYIVLNLLYLVWVFKEATKQYQITLNRTDDQQDSPFNRTFTADLEGQNRTIFVELFIPVLVQASPFLFLAYLAFPIGTDIYLYLHYGLMTLSGVNPFVVGAGDFTSILSPFVRWSQTSTYGPLSILVFSAASTLTYISPLLSIYLFKGICLILHIVNAFLLHCLLRNSRYQSLITLSYLLHPLLLFEQVSVAHIDVLMSTTLLCCITCFKSRRYVSGILSLWAGFLTKTLPIIWVPLGIIFLIKTRRWQSLIIAVLLMIASIAALQQTVLPTAEAWTSLLNPGVSGKAINSLQALLTLGLTYRSPVSMGLETMIMNGFEWVVLLGFSAYYALTLYRVGWHPETSESDLWLEIGWLTLVLLLFATPWLMPWYSSILLAIAALTVHSWRFILVVLTFALTSSCCYALLGTGIFQSLVTIGIPTLMLAISYRWDFPQFINKFVVRRSQT